jgi:hypothetical protein
LPVEPGKAGLPAAASSIKQSSILGSGKERVGEEGPHVFRNRDWLAGELSTWSIERLRYQSVIPQEQQVSGR